MKCPMSLLNRFSSFKMGCNLKMNIQDSILLACGTAEPVIYKATYFIFRQTSDVQTLFNFNE